MNRIIIILIFLHINSFIYSQQKSNYYLLGCENQKNRKIKDLCKPKTFNDLFLVEMSKIIDEYGDRVPTGKTNLQFTIMKDGSIDKFGYYDYDNENFAKLALYVLIQLASDLKKHNLFFNPIIDSVTGEKIDYIFEMPVKFLTE